MKNILWCAVLLVGLGGLMMTWLPWYCLLIAGSVAGWVLPWRRPLHAFLAALVITALWTGLLAGYMNAANNGILSARIGVLFQGAGPVVLILLTALFSALGTGLAAGWGAALRAMFRKKPVRA